MIRIYGQGIPILPISMLIAAMVLGGCKDNRTVRKYETPKVPKSSPTAMASDSPSGDAEAHPDSGYHWTAPDGWQEADPKTMQMARFTLSMGERQAECSVTELAGPAGGLVANVNRWRRQIGLPPAAAADIEADAQEAVGGLGPYQYFRLANEAAPDTAFLASVMPVGDKTLFVKLASTAGDQADLESAFVAFCRSIHLH